MHSYNCKHEKVVFCKKCNVPYCEECGKEWAEKCTLVHYSLPYYPYWQHIIPDVPCGDSTSSARVTFVTSCAHN